VTTVVVAPPRPVLPSRATSFARLVGLRFLRALASIVVSLAVIIALWYAFIKAFGLNPLVAKDPAAVWKYLVSDPEAHANRAKISKGLWRTLGDAGLGYVAGTVAATACAIAFVLSRTLERSLMPIVLVLRTMPLVALTPLLTLVFGRDILATTVISGIVVFFPSLVNMVFGLRSAPSAATDLCIAYGAGPFTTLRKVAIPSSLPAFFTSARLAVPGAIIGALLAEWLATGKGLGYLMLEAGTTFDYDAVWASVVIITTVSVVAFAFVGIIETAVLARYGPTPSRGR
jgi:ABC-type nitrate/sulfonate/bicarbonate transport system permease component